MRDPNGRPFRLNPGSRLRPPLAPELRPLFSERGGKARGCRSGKPIVDSVHFLPAVNKEVVPELLAKFDALYIGWRNSSLYRHGISPNKLFDYMMSGKPVLHSVNAANDPVKDADCGISVDSENPQAIADAIIELSQMSENRIKEMGENGRQYVLKNHDYSVLARNFLDVIK